MWLISEDLDFANVRPQVLLTLAKSQVSSRGLRRSRTFYVTPHQLDREAHVTDLYK